MKSGIRPREFRIYIQFYSILSAVKTKQRWDPVPILERKGCFFSRTDQMSHALVVTGFPPFSPALTAVLYDLSRQIPQLKKDIQDGLLKMLSLVLMHKPLRHPGMPKGLAHQLASPGLTTLPEASDVGSITLALRTLGSFEFEGKLVTLAKKVSDTRNLENRLRVPRIPGSCLGPGDRVADSASSSSFLYSFCILLIPIFVSLSHTKTGKVDRGYRYFEE